MKNVLFSAVVFSAVLICRTGAAEDQEASQPSMLPADFQRTLMFIMQVSTYQGYFDSVDRFCKPHVEALILKQAKFVWDRNIEDAIKLRDREMARTVDEAVANDLPAENLEKIRNWSETHYRKSVERDKFYKDLPSKFGGNLNLACAQRLGEMTALNMRLERVAPEAWQYLQEFGGTTKQ